MDALNEWMQSNQTILWILGTLSVVTFFGSLIIVPWLVLQIPADYFLGETRSERRPQTRHPILRVLILIAKNGVGALLLITGLAMLLFPGQGLLTLFMGLMLIDFPGKYRLQCRVVRIPFILRSLNWIRERRGRSEILVREPATPAPESGESR